MNIVILGAGDLGRHLAICLAKEDHNVTIIDKDAQKLAKISGEDDVATLWGYGSQWEMLDNLIETSPSLFIAMTGDDETNLVACNIAKNLGYPKTICRVKNIGFLRKSRLDFERLFAVDHFLAAEMLAAHDILKSIIHPHDLAIQNFAHGSIQMRTISVPDTWDKMEIPISRLDLPHEIIISLIRRKIPTSIIEEKEEEAIIFPHGGDVIQPFDEITVIGETNTMRNLSKIFYCPKESIKSVIIVGGSAVAANLASILCKMNITVKIIEKDEKRCKELADALPNAIIVNHDGTNINFLASEQVHTAGAFIAATSHDDKNLLISLLAKNAGCKKIVTLIADANLSSILDELEIKFTISEKVNIVNKILSLIHAESVVSIASLYQDKAKVVEIKISPKSELIGIPIQDLSKKLPKDMLIAAIENRGQVMIGKGDKVISPNDTIIIITSPNNLPIIKEIF
jgi:trk system potassium uptake protein TrkA